MKTSTIQRLKQSEACQTLRFRGEHCVHKFKNWHQIDTRLFASRSPLSQGEAA